MYFTKTFDRAGTRIGIHFNIIIFLQGRNLRDSKVYTCIPQILFILHKFAMKFDRYFSKFLTQIKTLWTYYIELMIKVI